jgi:DNA-binding SARP family transcriptional activator
MRARLCAGNRSPLVVFLARRAPRAVSRTELATLFWGERGEERARQSLRQALLELKHALGDSVDIDAEMVRLPADAVALDIVTFEQDVASGRLSDAVDRWTGDFFEGAEDIGGDGLRRWIESERSGLHQQLGMAMERLIGDTELRGDWAGAAKWAERWAGAVPFDEKAHLRLIESLRMNGRGTDALKTHAAFVSRVRTSLDLDPSVEFLRLGGGLADEARTELARKGRVSVAVHDPQLVGRAAVLDELSEGWLRARGGTPLVVVVRGEGGSGLTRIADELATRAQADGLVLRGSGEPSAIFKDLQGAPGIAGAAPEALAAVSRIVPALASAFPGLPVSPSDEATLRDSLIQVLAAVSEERPVLILAEDLHQANESSLRFVAAIAQKLSGSVLLVVTHDEGAAQPDLAMASILGVRGVRRIQLEELGVTDVETMLGSMVTMEPADRHALAMRLYEDSSGFPYAVRELVVALVDDHLLKLDGSGIWRVSPALAGRPLPVPVAWRERVRRRLEGFQPASRAVADAIAVLGEATDPAVAASVVQLSPDDADRAMRDLVARRILRESLTNPGRFAFASPLLARTVASLIPPTRRQGLHQRAAEVLSENAIATTSERSLLPYHIARAEPTPVSTAAFAPREVSWKVIVGGLATLGFVILAVLLFRGRANPGATGDPKGHSIVALGRIADYRENRSSDLTKPLTDMLATNLGRVAGLRVVSSARMFELMGQGDGPGRDSAAALVAAARRAGATELLDGALYARDDGGFRLDLRRVEIATGSILKTHSVAGTTLFELADSGTARLAADFGGSGPVSSVADVMTRSESAYRLYEEGLRAYYANDPRSAEPLFDAALAEDSTFAMAAYYSALSAASQPRKQIQRFNLAARLATRTSDRERLIILAYQAFIVSSPSLGPIADTLVVRYPDEREGYYFTGLARIMDGRFLEGVPALNRIVAMDSLALTRDRPSCDACEALRQIVQSYLHADSLAAAEREVRRWIRLQPKSPVAYRVLADVLSMQGRYPEADAALDQEASLDAGRREAERLVTRALHKLYAGDYPAAERLFAGELESGVPFRIGNALWYRIIGYRQQGRLSEALADARRLRTIALPNYPKDVVRSRRALPQESLAEGQVLYELGRYREAAAVFDSVSRFVVGDESPSQVAHAQVWSMTHAARAMIAGGDTARANARLDSIRVLGMESGNGRDKVLHHYVRGLMLAARGQDSAAVIEMRQAVWSPSFGYTQVNLALGASLTRQGRYSEAVAILTPALHGPLEASNYYVSRTDVHDMLARAWEGVGTPAGRDSAAAHRRIVESAWDQADSAFIEQRRAGATAPQASRTEAPGVPR